MSAASASEQQDLEIKQIRKKVSKSWMILYGQVEIFIDTANVYCKWLEGHGNCSEQIIGRWLKARGAREKVIVATKGAHYSFENPGRSRVTGRISVQIWMRA